MSNYDFSGAVIVGIVTDLAGDNGQASVLVVDLLKSEDQAFKNGRRNAFLIGDVVCGFNRSDDPLVVEATKKVTSLSGTTLHAAIGEILQQELFYDPVRCLLEHENK